MSYNPLLSTTLELSLFRVQKIINDVKSREDYKANPDSYKEGIRSYESITTGLIELLKKYGEHLDRDKIACEISDSLMAILVLLVKTTIDGWGDGRNFLEEVKKEVVLFCDLINSEKERRKKGDNYGYHWC